MDGRTDGEPLTDSALDRELQQTLAIEPSPEFAARVRVRIANETMSTPWPTWGWAYIAGALAAAVAVAAAVMPSSRGGLSSAIASRPALTAQVQHAPAVAARGGAPADMRSSARSRPGRTTNDADAGSGLSRTTGQANAPSDRDGLPDVVVSPEEQRAFWAFVAAERAHLLPPMPVPAREDTDQEGHFALPPVEIAPIRIEPLSQVAQMEGERP